MPAEPRARRIRLRPALVLDENHVEWRFVRAAGPGGQNVNKVSSAAQLRYDARTHLPPDVYSRLGRIAGGRLSAEGVLVLTARSQRTQAGNRREAFDRLVELLRRAAVPSKPRTATRPTAASRTRRLESKRQRGASKARRRRVTDVEE